jgi:hypothetical protein
MNETHQPINWIRRKHKLIFALALIAFAIALFGLYRLYVANYVREQTEKLLANPIPLPAIIAGVRPRPGTQDETVSEVCVSVWLKMLPPNHATKDFATTLATLSIDGSPMFFISGVYATMPPDQCWSGDFRVLHLAEITVQSAMSGTLRYQWAFVGR